MQDQRSKMRLASSAGKRHHSASAPNALPHFSPSRCPSGAWHIGRQDYGAPKVDSLKHRNYIHLGLLDRGASGGEAEHLFVLPFHLWYHTGSTRHLRLGLSATGSEIEDAGAGVERREAPPLGVRAQRLGPLLAVEMPVGGIVSLILLHP